MRRQLAALENELRQTQLKLAVNAAAEITKLQEPASAATVANAGLVESLAGVKAALSQAPVALATTAEHTRKSFRGTRVLRPPPQDTRADDAAAMSENGSSAASSAATKVCICTCKTIKDFN